MKKLILVLLISLPLVTFASTITVNNIEYNFDQEGVYLDGLISSGASFEVNFVVEKSEYSNDNYDSLYLTLWIPETILMEGEDITFSLKPLGVFTKDLKKQCHTEPQNIPTYSDLVGGDFIYYTFMDLNRKVIRNKKGRTRRIRDSGFLPMPIPGASSGTISFSNIQPIDYPPDLESDPFAKFSISMNLNPHMISFKRVVRANSCKKSKVKVAKEETIYNVQADIDVFNYITKIHK
jgi:hypothetical protein